MSLPFRQLLLVAFNLFYTSSASLPSLCRFPRGQAEPILDEKTY